MPDLSGQIAERTSNVDERHLVAPQLVFDNLPHMNQRSLFVPEIHLQAKTVRMIDNRSDYSLFNSASMQVCANALANLELAFWLFWFAGHGEILYQTRCLKVSHLLMLRSHDGRSPFF